MKRWFIPGGLAGLLAAVLLTTFAFTGAERVNTEDIDAIYGHYNRRLDTGIPSVSGEEVIDKAFEGSENLPEDIDTSNLETRATVGLCTGLDSRGNFVENHKAWLVVVDNIPTSFPSGPYTIPESRVDQHRPETADPNSRVLRGGNQRGNPGAISGRWG